MHHSETLEINIHSFNKCRKDLKTNISFLWVFVPFYFCCIPAVKKMLKRYASMVYLDYQKFLKEIIFYNIRPRLSFHENDIP